MNVAIDDRYRRRGVATALIEHLFSETDRHGERYTLEVRASNVEAINMYESFGFRSAGIRRRYYHDNNEDALIMWRTHHGTAQEVGAPVEQTQL
jgi:ribosomal-protein-alanine N-acetyltransferase